jgi:alkylated DNA nucleotide flippase Atl1
MKARKSWREKLDNPKLPKVVPVPPKWEKQYGQGMMLVPGPQEIVYLVREVPEGATITMGEIRDRLARAHCVDATCPLVTGILLRIVAEVAEEDARAGSAEITPYWRVVKDDGSLNPKFPGGVELQAERLRAEGHRIVAGAGKKPPRVARLAAA